MDLVERIRSVLALDPEAPAVEFEDRWYSWGELARLMKGVDDALSAAGLGEDAAIAVMLRNRPSLLGAMMSVIASRRCVITVTIPATRRIRTGITKSRGRKRDVISDPPGPAAREAPPAPPRA